MKRVFYTDKDGWVRCSLVRDSDTENNPAIGVPLNPPDLTNVLDNSKKLLHNELVSRGLFTFDDIQKAQSGLSSAILAVFKNAIIEEYRKNDRRS